MAVGAGLQSTVAVINLVCFYLIGIPVGALLGYVGRLQVTVMTLQIVHYCFYCTKMKHYQLRFVLGWAGDMDWNDLWGGYSDPCTLLHGIQNKLG